MMGVSSLSKLVISIRKLENREQKILSSGSFIKLFSIRANQARTNKVVREGRESKGVGG